MLERQLGSDPAARAALTQAKREIALSLDELRDVARGLHPAGLSGHGLPVALESLAARAAVPVRLTVRLTAVRRVARGGSAIDPSIVSTLLSKRRVDDPLGRLTPRERQVLELMASGHSNQGIADRLVITLRAVEKYVSTIFDKLGIPTASSQSRRVLAVLLYLRS